MRLDPDRHLTVILENQWRHADAATLSGDFQVTFSSLMDFRSLGSRMTDCTRAMYSTTDSR